MSVWGNYATTANTVPPGLRIRWSPDDKQHRVFLDDQELFADPQYYPCHRWCQNHFRLTSTAMMPVYEAYEGHIREVDPGDQEDEPADQGEPPVPEPAAQPSAAPVADVAPEPSAPAAPVSPAEPVPEKPPNRFRKPGT